MPCGQAQHGGGVRRGSRLRRWAVSNSRTASGMHPIELFFPVAQQTVIEPRHVGVLILSPILEGAMSATKHGLCQVVIAIPLLLLPGAALALNPQPEPPSRMGQV
jgi:hypothetical protein